MAHYNFHTNNEGEHRHNPPGYRLILGEEAVTLDHHPDENRTPMEFLSFNTFFPEKTKKEIRRIVLNRPWNGLEKGIYTFFELYCTDVTCDCRCAMIKVCDEFGVTRATLSYRWESRRFHAGGKGSNKYNDGMSGVKLCSSKQQGKDYLKFLNIFEGFIRNDPFYAKRIQMHYFQVKEKQKSTEQYRKLSYHPVLDRWISIGTGKKSSDNDPLDETETTPN